MNEQMFFDGMSPVDTRSKLEKKFIVPPFSVLDTRQGYWQNRKRLWISLGIHSELGRGEELTFQGEQITSENLNYYRNRETEKELEIAGKPLLFQNFGLHPYDGQKKQRPGGLIDGLTFKATGFMADIMTERGGGTSIFDPVLCEIMYKWFCPKKGTILDPFAGGSVRGIVAAILGYTYYGIDLSNKQIVANTMQAQEIVPNNVPTWIVGNSKNIEELLEHDLEFDFIFSCPPYFNLEQYSNDKEDLSNLKWHKFMEEYKTIIANSVRRLKLNRFACFVVSEIRDKDGFMRSFVPYTIECFNKAHETSPGDICATIFYNEIILLNVAGSLPARITKQFSAGRKVGRTHQNILIFYKGCPKEISKHFRSIDSNME